VARPDLDLVRHHYNRRALWGTDTVLYRKNHPMEWTSVEGNYHNWEIDTSDMAPPDALFASGEPARLFASDDLSVLVSRRRESMPHFFRNCDADELHLVSQGTVRYETDFGDVELSERDFLLIPKGVTYRVVLDDPQDTLRLIYESGPEIFLIPAEMVEHIYHKGRPAIAPERLTRPTLRTTPPPEGQFEVRVKYSGAFADVLGETTTLHYDRYPLDTQIIDGEQPVVKFSVADIEKLGSTPVPFVGGAYLDNKANLAWTLHLSGGGGLTAPVHRNADVDELRWQSSGPRKGRFQFSPQGVDHGYGRGYTQRERNRPDNPNDGGDVLSAYTIRPLKGTALAYEHARAVEC
jgi:homogentisate 1,2-dioxygenase